MKKYDKRPDADELSTKDRSILKSDVRDVATTFWKYMQIDSKDTFLDADIKDATKWVYNFLNNDVVGKKIILLDDEKLRTANVVARVLKRKRRIKKTGKAKKTISKVKEIYDYLHHPFWQNSIMVGTLRKYLDDHLRRMTPAILKGLNANVEKLQTYFTGVVFDNRILAADKKLKKMAMDFGYSQFAICEKHKRPLVKDEAGDILCTHTDCGTGRCPFDANKPHGEEVVFLAGLKNLLAKEGIIRDIAIA